MRGGRDPKVPATDEGEGNGARSEEGCEKGNGYAKGLKICDFWYMAIALLSGFLGLQLESRLAANKKRRLGASIGTCLTSDLRQLQRVRTAWEVEEERRAAAAAAGEASS